MCVCVCVCVVNGMRKVSFSSETPPPLHPVVPAHNSPGPALIVVVVGWLSFPVTSLTFFNAT